MTASVFNSCPALPRHIMVEPWCESCEMSLAEERDLPPAAIFLAAGFSSRMGAFKPLLPLGPERVIQRLIRVYRAAGIERVVAVVGHQADRLIPLLEHHRVEWVVNPRPEEGMFSSGRLGGARLGTPPPAFFVQPADVPLVRPATLEHLMRRRRGVGAGVVIPLTDGRRGHPPLLDSCLAGPILQFDGGGGLRALLERQARSILETPCGDPGILAEMNTPEEYRRLLAELDREPIPAEAEILALWREYALPPTLEAHSRAVAAAAVRLGEALSRRGLKLNLELLRAGALLHDLRRDQPDHAETAGQVLRRLGYGRTAAVVASHMDIYWDDQSPVDEAALVYLADKLFRGATQVGLERRFAEKLDRYGDDPAARLAVQARLDKARRVAAAVSAALGGEDAAEASPLRRHPPGR